MYLTVKARNQGLSCGKPKQSFLKFLPKKNFIWLTPPKSRATLLCKAAVFCSRKRPQVV